MNKQKFNDNLKNVFSKVGIENQPVVFIIDKVDIIEEGSCKNIYGEKCLLSHPYYQMFVVGRHIPQTSLCILRCSL